MQYSYTASTTTGRVFTFFSALGDVAFAYAGHNVVLEIQATIPSTPEKPSKGPMWKGVIFAYIVVALCYFPVALIGYWMFGNSVADNILITLEKPRWLIAGANMFVVIHVIGSYQVEIEIFSKWYVFISSNLHFLISLRELQIYAMPVFDMLETLLVKNLKFRPSFMLRLITRTLYVGGWLMLFFYLDELWQSFISLFSCSYLSSLIAAFTMFVGILIPFFGSLLGFLGGLAFAPTTYFVRNKFPHIMLQASY